MKSVMQNQFAQQPSVDVPRSTFNLSHGHKTTLDADWLVPVDLLEVVPGDSIRCKASYMARLATPTYPIMDNLYMDLFFFYVPYRLLWNDPTGGSWEKFCGAQEDPADTIDYTVPKLASTTTFNVQTGDPIFDYMGLPYVTSLDCSEVSALPFRAYNKIYNDWFRDQNLIDSEAQRTGDGPDSTNDYDLLKRCKKHDYFTSCLPWPQKTAGTDEITLPLGTTAPVVFSGINNDDIILDDDTVQPGVVNWKLDTDGLAGGQVKADGPSGSLTANIYADLSYATASTINELRQAFQLQRLLERDARSGTRYVEHIKAHWRVTVPDFRLQRSEFLGAGSQRVNITPVAQTNFNGDVGRLGGFGTVSSTTGFTKSFVEHGIIIALANVRADITYQQGLERFWTRDTRYDYFLPVLSGLGEMAVLNKEIYYQNTSADDDVFGYQESWADYRFKPSRISGLFRSDHASTLDIWHLSEDFSSLPTLGKTFIESNTGVPLDRAIAVPSEPHFIADFFFDIKAARPMPLHGVPGMLDHF